MPQNTPVQRLKCGNPTTKLRSSGLVTLPRELNITFKPQWTANLAPICGKKAFKRKWKKQNIIEHATFFLQGETLLSRPDSWWTIVMFQSMDHHFIWFECLHHVTATLHDIQHWCLKADAIVCVSSDPKFHHTIIRVKPLHGGSK